MIKFLISNGNLDNQLKSQLGVLVLRLFAGLTLAFAHGLGKLPPHEQFVGFITSLGLPAPSLMAWAAGLAEFLGGLLVAIGLLTRPAALSVIVTMVVAAFMAHGSDPFQKKEMALLYLVIYLAIFLMGPGKLSLDHGISKKS